MKENFVCIYIKNKEEYLDSMFKAMKIEAKANIKNGLPCYITVGKHIKNFNNEKLYTVFVTFFK